jgi:hypothetical protein
MAVNVFPAPSTGPEVPQGLRPPKITYNTSYSLTGLTDIANFTSSSNRAMTYRTTDNSLYFVGADNSGLYKFDLSNNTGSRVSTAMGTSRKDLMAAQDGTLYFINNLEVGADANYQFSTNGGVNWTSMGTSDTLDRGWITVVDNGYIPGITGNIMWANRYLTAGLGSRFTINNVNTNRSVVFANVNKQSNFLSGINVFPVRDGDDSFPVKFALTDATTSADANGPLTQSNQVHFRYASIGTSRTNQSGVNQDNIQVRSSSPNGSSFTATDYGMLSGVNTGGRPTSIQNRWLLNVTHAAGSSNPFIYNIFDYENNFTRVAEGALLVDFPGITNNNALPQAFSNPIYISATKKLYIMYAYYQSGAGNARMYEYDVTTY